MRILKFKEKNLNKAVKKAVISIKNGDVLVCPTDTVYGLVCDATSRKAVKELFRIKKRPKEKPIPIFVKDLKMAKRFAYINRSQEKFLKKAWPGKVTAVVKAKPGAKKIFPEGIISPENKVGLRIPRYELVNVLLEELNLPLTGTSANISGQPPSTKIKEVLDQFRGQRHQPDLIIDAGNLKKAKPSMVIDLTGSKPRILRK